ncbi:D-alanyl-D-alanine carboxypeptidase/D-alanyl-D-alanine endopeptidase [Marinobacter qingdaonensis]|uniref:D-alanyl-D-alanine carboxypeptidase/D-alanyl-D-alanine-endopeptidase n=1 Tax=Marinobacter qingdaonensis TaxID=3108486 RepID=A0ABU5NUC2_9GAMM|nr:D-alanyl-D-alanine carboxypeptidase/D-alanyl-D-alanine-endopeptidase [Marinobacter sp. ASW11-75]MEA1079378.1 D-alanyl-D-alanine carboxypeptidase/D-alanyl-D-alanine-endopeptidase [Marinobacter sp. ASW11-75]
MQRAYRAPHRRSVLKRTVIAAGTALALAASAGVQALEGGESEYSSAGTWSKQVRDYAHKSLNNDDALSMAAIPLNGPGIEQYINADELMSPGSIMKLVTTFAALEILGPTHHWDTDFLTDGKLVGDTLEGNLYVRFGGDPKLTLERLWSTLRELRGMGVTTINGDLVLDGSYFRVDEGFPLFEDNGDNPHAPFLVEPSAYLSNLNLLHFQVRADERGTQAWSTPNLAEVMIDNRVIATAEGPCPSRRNFDWEPIFHDDNRVTVRVTGELPQGCRTTSYLSLLPHDQYSASLIRSLLEETGVALTGSHSKGVTPEEARLVLKTTSPDLVTMVRDINKWSSNVMARQMLLTIGAENRLDGEDDDRVAGIRVIYQWMENKGINTAGMVIDNGAGLSRHGRITARQGARLLQHAWNSPFAADLMASLPIIAMDGTMARRLRNTGMDGSGRIKTGYLEDVRSIAGFTRDEHNTTWAVVGMVNNDPAWNGQAVLDRILYSLHYRPPTGTAISRAESGSSSETSIQ